MCGVCERASVFVQALMMVYVRIQEKALFCWQAFCKAITIHCITNQHNTHLSRLTPGVWAVLDISFISILQYYFTSNVG